MGYLAGDVVMMHATISGCSTDTGVSLSGGPRIPKDCDFVDYWALGDIHKMQALNPYAWYSGSPYQTDFGEDRPKGVLIVDTDNPTEPTFHELTAAKPFVTLLAVPRLWPEDEYIRLSIAAKDIPEDLPPCVVQVQTLKRETANAADEIYETKEARKERYLQGMPEYLESQGLSLERITHCMHLAEALVRKL